MQYKVILFSVAGLLLYSDASYAQHVSKGRIRVSPSALSTESIDSLGVIGSPKTTVKPALLAENIAPSPTIVAPVVPKPAPVASLPAVTHTPVDENDKVDKDGEKPKYSLVPLAGTKSYFGEKNEYVNNYVRTYLEVHNKTLNNVQNVSSKPFDLIDEVLERKQLPKELKYLAVIESALNHKAVSSAGAVGPWQLMESTAKMMGISVTRRSDDRTDWSKSTAAATKYLELLYSQLDDWLLVIAAYNSGPTPVQRAIDRTGSHNFWDIKEYLPRETQGHVLAFIATASIFENLSKFINLGSIPVDFKFGKEEDLPALKKEGASSKPAPFASNAIDKTGDKKPQFTDQELKGMAMVRIKEPIHLEMMAQELGIDKKLLARWNSDYDLFVYKTYPTPFYNLRIPKNKLDVFIAKKDHLTRRSEAIYAQTPMN